MAAAKKKTHDIPACLTGQKGKEVFGRIYRDYIVSEAFLDLSKSQRVLVVCMIVESFRQSNHPPKGSNSFYFPRSLYITKCTGSYQLYGNGALFSRDKSALIEHGFIAELENNQNLRKRNVYKLSADWQQWKRPA